MTGRKLGHFTIKEKLGEGGMGVVYEARDEHLDRPVALKLLQQDALAHPAGKQRFVKEAKAASALNHPHIVTIYDISRDGGVDYIAMELIRGRSLEDELSRGKLGLSEALRYGIQMASALAAAHAAGIVHRDLKPGNIMINERGDVKVLDFGLAKLADPPSAGGEDEAKTRPAATREGTVLGSAPYMSPEQAEGRKLDARSDIFSFGSVLYEMLSGKRAFEGSSFAATMAAVLKDEPAPLTEVVRGLPRELETLVASCLRKDAERRVQSIEEIHVALKELQERKERGPVGADARRSWWPYAAATAVLACAAIGMFLFMGRRPVVAIPESTMLTSFVGRQDSPSLSPDGKQFAFTWDGDDPNGKMQVYISLVGQGTPLRLTSEAGGAFWPSWSPDGQSIALFRGAGENELELVVMPALGGHGRRIATLQGGSYVRRAASWSPDGKWLVWGEVSAGAHSRSGLRAVSSAGGETQVILDSTAGTKDIAPAFSPDGRKVVFVRTIGTDTDEDLYIAGFDAGRLTNGPQRLTSNRKRKWTPLWTQDGREIVYGEGGLADNERFINRVDAAGGEPKRLPGFGDGPTNLTMAANADRMAYASVSNNFDILRLDLKTSGAKPERFLSSTRFDGSPSYSPDGKRIAFSSNRGGSREIWIANADGTNAAALTSFGSGVVGSPKWSPDGKLLAFDARPQGNAEIYTMPAEGGVPKRLTNSPGEDHIPTWSPDGEWIYFGSVRGGEHEIFRMHTDGSAVQRMTHNGGFYGMVSPDGKTLYYSVTGNGLWKMPVDGGTPTQLLPDNRRSAFSFVVKNEGVYAVEGNMGQQYPILVHPTKGGKPQTVTILERRVHLFFDLSPDGRYLIFSSPAGAVQEIRMVDNFR
ncbi:MAG: serine/threonine-protein kinase [Acidobacteria bacterium]|nr:serine/threonine-protein kinase [Acidobacteriota bacterium]